MFKVWLEWDYGQDYLAFSTEEKAIVWINRMCLEDDFINAIYPLGYIDLLEDGLCDIQKLTIDP